MNVVDPKQKTGLNVSFMNQTEPFNRLNDLVIAVSELRTN